MADSGSEVVGVPVVVDADEVAEVPVIEGVLLRPGACDSDRLEGLRGAVAARSARFCHTHSIPEAPVASCSIGRAYALDVDAGTPKKGMHHVRGQTQQI